MIEFIKRQYCCHGPCIHVRVLLWTVVAARVGHSSCAMYSALVVATLHTNFNLLYVIQCTSL